MYLRVYSDGPKDGEFEMDYNTYAPGDEYEVGDKLVQPMSLDPFLKVDGEPHPGPVIWTYRVATVDKQIVMLAFVGSTPATFEGEPGT